MTTALQIIRDALEEVGSISNISTVVGSVAEKDSTVRRAVAAFRAEGRSLRLGHTWDELVREHTLTTAADQAYYDLPGDFDSSMTATFWDRSNYWELDGPVTPAEWQFRKSGISQTYPRKQFRFQGVEGNQIRFHPTPTASNAGETIVFEYQSKNWLRPATWAANTSYSAGQYTWNAGNYYVTTNGGTSGATAPTHTSGLASDGGVDWDYYSGSYTRLLRDDDVPILDEDLITLGTRWRFMESLGQNYGSVMGQYMALLGGRKSRFARNKIYRLNERRGGVLITNAAAPDGGWSL